MREVLREVFFSVAGLTDVFQRRAAGGAGETLHVQVLLLDAHEDASAKKKIKPKRQFVVFFV